MQRMRNLISLHFKFNTTRGRKFFLRARTCVERDEFEDILYKLVHQEIERAKEKPTLWMRTRKHFIPDLMQQYRANPCVWPCSLSFVILVVLLQAREHYRFTIIRLCADLWRF
jgi:hypothetical protein